jgi:glycosyltransferase involved in cell wall biosynthesis
MAKREGMPAQRWLWLTFAYPEPPTNGQFLYSKGLIQAAAAAGVGLDVVALGRPDSVTPPSHDNLRWSIAGHRPRSRWASLMSPLPHMANMANTHALRRLLAERLSAATWDAIVFDSLGTGWALRQVSAALDTASRRPPLVYLAHNHETSLARRIAAVHPHPLKRQINRADALKIAILERALARAADVILTNSPDDCALFRRDYPDKPVEVIHPVFVGERVAARQIGPDVPRRAVMVGSFEWLPKRVNLAEFVEAADPLFAAAGVELQIVGAGEPHFLDALRRASRATTFTGPINDPAPYLAAARVGIIAERIGGGFKLKSLDYVFNRVPIAALAGTMPGLPLREGESAIICADAGTLARRIIDIIDDFETLNRLQANAHETCRDVFDVTACGRSLLSAVSRVAPGLDAADTLLAPA